MRSYERAPATHFLSIPLTADAVQRRCQRFKEDVLDGCADDKVGLVARHDVTAARPRDL